MSAERDDPRRRGADEHGPELTRHLRALLAPPGGDAYWDGLEARVMARVGRLAAEERAGWWGCFERWLRPGLVAAGLAVGAALLALARSRDADARLAYEAVLAQPQPVAAGPATPAGVRAATLEYVISH